MKKLTSKGKHTVKVENHPSTKLVGMLKDKSSQIIYIHNKQLRDTQNNYIKHTKNCNRGEKSTMHLKWRDQQLKTLCVYIIYRLLCKSHVWLFGIPWTVARQAPLSIGFSRQEYWRGLPFPPPGESSWARDQTWVSCVSGLGRRALYPWFTWGLL